MEGGQVPTFTSFQEPCMLVKVAEDVPYVPAKFETVIADNLVK
jgi:hypothetical protein